MGKESSTQVVITRVLMRETRSSRSQERRNVQMEVEMGMMCPEDGWKGHSRGSHQKLKRVRSCILPSEHLEGTSAANTLTLSQ